MAQSLAQAQHFVTPHPFLETGSSQTDEQVIWLSSALRNTNFVDHVASDGLGVYWHPTGRPYPLTGGSIGGYVHPVAYNSEALPLSVDAVGSSELTSYCRQRTVPLNSVPYQANSSSRGAFPTQNPLCNLQMIRAQDPIAIYGPGHTNTSTSMAGRPPDVQVSLQQCKTLIHKLESGIGECQ